MTLIAGIIFLVPLLCRRLHIPVIVGLLLAGMAVGPYGFSLIGESGTMDIFSQLGILYIMFLSGIEIDMADFKRNSVKSLLFGLLTFAFPAMLAVVLGRFILHYSWISSLLLGAMLGSHTLMTYPIVSRYNVQRNTAVNIVTMVAVTLSLFALAAVSGWQQGNNSFTGWLLSVGKICVFVGVVMYLFPLIAKLFFKHVNDPFPEFMLVIIMLVGASLLAQLAGLEGILGAFLVGVSLNRLIPNLSPLMNRLNFVGNALLIPLFLLSVGMLVDIRAFWSGWAVISRQRFGFACSPPYIQVQQSSDGACVCSHPSNSRRYTGYRYTRFPDGVVLTNSPAGFRSDDIVLVLIGFIPH